MRGGFRLAAALPVLATVACAHAPLPEPKGAVVAAGAECRTASASLHFDFTGAAPSACGIAGERDFVLLVTPEHAPPINPSPWYAFRYEAAGDAPLTVTLRYLAGQHRYAPKWSDGDGAWRELPSEPADDGRGAMLRLPARRGLVAAQEIITPEHAGIDLQRWSQQTGTQPFLLGYSHDGRPVEAVRFGRADAPRLVILLGRQHPPEVSGAIAMRAFVDALVVERARAPQSFHEFQFLVVPMLNPDGVAHGHWRANRGAKDLNRDWGEFSQPETRAVKSWLEALPRTVRPVAMLDFHSTKRNLFYVQSEDDTDEREERFLTGWLAGKEAQTAGYPFSIERRDANPGGGTAKNWFHRTYDIPAYTYEVGDETDREAIRISALSLARTFADQLEQLATDPR